MSDGKKKEVTRLLKRGLNHYGLGELEAAIASWEKALVLDPQNCAARDYLETAYEESTETGAKMATSGEDATPRTFDAPAEFELDGDEEPDTLVAEALQAYKAGRIEQAWDTMQQVAARDPERLDVQGYIAMLPFAQNDHVPGHTVRHHQSQRPLLLLPGHGIVAEGHGQEAHDNADEEH